MKKLVNTIAAVSAAAVPVVSATPASAGVDPFLGEISIYPYTFCPRSWVSLEGQLLSISQYTALFSLLGTTFGGDGRTTFALPDLRGRSPMGQGSGPGLTPRTQGQQFGSETNTITANQMPSHSHSLRGLEEDANSDELSGNFLAHGVTAYRSAAAPDGTANGQSISASGGGQPVNNIQPTLVLRYCIATQGVFPSRN